MQRYARMHRCIAVCRGVLQHLKSSTPETVANPVASYICSMDIQPMCRCRYVHAYGCVAVCCSVLQRLKPRWHDSFLCVPWLIHLCDVTQLYVCLQHWILQLNVINSQRLKLFQNSMLKAHLEVIATHCNARCNARFNARCNARCNSRIHKHRQHVTLNVWNCCETHRWELISSDAQHTVTHNNTHCNRHRNTRCNRRFNTLQRQNAATHCNTPAQRNVEGSFGEYCR